jgi:hypothetical protein
MDVPSNGEEPRWHAGLAVIAALVLYVTLPAKLVVGPVWVLPVVLAVILVPLMIVSPHRRQEAAWQRWASIAHIAVLNAFNVGTVVELLIWVLEPHRVKHPLTGDLLLKSAVQIWLTNIIVYALWFWEIDRHGPEVRERGTPEQQLRRADFLFPQMALQPELRFKWKPKFFDYIFLSFTNATAFSPTDTFPLTPFAKLLMMGEALTSLVTIAVIAGRAINILGT